MMKKLRVNIQTINKMARLLFVLGDKTRLKIMMCLINERECTCCCGELKCCGKCFSLTCMIEKSVSDIVDSTGCSQSLISHQLKILKDLDLVKTRKEGLRVYYSLKDGHVKELLNSTLEHVEEK